MRDTTRNSVSAIDAHRARSNHGAAPQLHRQSTTALVKRGRLMSLIIERNRMFYSARNRHSAALRFCLTASLAAAGVLAGAAAAVAAPAAHKAHHHHQAPITLTVFSPGAGDDSGVAGANFVVDLSLDASKSEFNPLLSEAAGYKPFFNDPASPTFHPGADPGAPGLVVLLSTTPDTVGTALQGPNTNLAGLFQINGVATVGGNAETWNTWQVGKPLFGTGPTVLTAYVVEGTAPAVLPEYGVKKISNVVHVPFTIQP
jgi:hypothetical protein